MVVIAACCAPACRIPGCLHCVRHTVTDAAVAPARPLTNHPLLVLNEQLLSDRADPELLWHLSAAKLAAAAGVAAAGCCCCCGCFAGRHWGQAAAAVADCGAGVCHLGVCCCCCVAQAKNMYVPHPGCQRMIEAAYEDASARLIIQRYGLQQAQKNEWSMSSYF